MSKYSNNIEDIAKDLKTQLNLRHSDFLRVAYDSRITNGGFTYSVELKDIPYAQVQHGESFRDRCITIPRPELITPATIAIASQEVAHETGHILQRGNRAGLLNAKYDELGAEFFARICMKFSLCKYLRQFDALTKPNEDQNHIYAHAKRLYDELPNDSKREQLCIELIKLPYAMFRVDGTQQVARIEDIVANANLPDYN